MKASKPRTLWIIILSVIYTANACIKAIFRKMTGTINRNWVDKTMRRWVDRILKLVRVNVKVVNPHDVKPKENEPTIIMCNHSSLYDIPISIKAFPYTSIRMLAKKEMSKVPVMAGGMKAAEFPFVDRKNRAQAIKDLEYARELMESGIVMWIAPEGTRSRDGTLSKFKKGAFITAIQAQATIIPIGIRGAFQILPAKTHQFNINQTAEVHIGEPIDASKYTLENKEELIERTHQVMKQLVGEQ
ncbi:lysophospholipid acyltransferase family protein [Legionella impletisoli]|uniref:1-acyl-sn-glycerol-3-phosphate acyltransferase n=1 Tax=Legionella impletisoli TaxID=343510 RepID=A0A917NCL8_9GAMM|nr:lysophospholipid acyltransferase family protein [Legionella impletisoli]GGI88830.1 1-acyl-sn-glycerol-3-phosphate acyltransferase [Legionella impletisoli]